MSPGTPKIKFEIHMSETGLNLKKLRFRKRKLFSLIHERLFLSSQTSKISSIKKKFRGNASQKILRRLFCREVGSG